MSAPALPVSLEQAHDSFRDDVRYPHAEAFVDYLRELILPSLATLSPAQSERLEAAYLAGAKCIDDAGLLLAVPRDALLILTAPEPEREPGAPVLKLLKAAQVALSHWLQPDGPNDNDTLGILVALLDGPEQRAAEAQAERDAVQAELWRFAIASTNEGVEMQILDDLAQRMAVTSVESYVAFMSAGLAEFKRRTT